MTSVSGDAIANAEARIGLTFDPSLKELWEFTNGSNNQTWFAVVSDELTPLSFPSFEESVESWSWHLPYDETTYAEWNVDDERDPRIQPNYIRHRLWFPFAETNGFSTSVLFDADPVDKGDYGQIIVYQHDPDAIYYVAQDFLEFFRKSNELLEANAKELLLGEYS
ncbi:MAG TPA: SMI1/KNR4 family protein [Pyrinomonadaceae bacterium]|nr:SMI1/KNR4 family protein [Pyrinomonadaceae bacterium]